MTPGGSFLSFSLSSKFDSCDGLDQEAHKCTNTLVENLMDYVLSDCHLKLFYMAAQTTGIAIHLKCLQL